MELLLFQRVQGQEVCGVGKAGGCGLIACKTVLTVLSFMAEKLGDMVWRACLHISPLACTSPLYLVAFLLKKSTTCCKQIKSITNNLGYCICLGFFIARYKHTSLLFAYTCVYSSETSLQKQDSTSNMNQEHQATHPPYLLHLSTVSL